MDSNNDEHILDDDRNDSDGLGQPNEEEEEQKDDGGGTP